MAINAVVLVLTYNIIQTLFFFNCLMSLRRLSSQHVYFFGIIVWSWFLVRFVLSNLHTLSNIPHSHYSWLTAACIYILAGDDVIPEEKLALQLHLDLEISSNTSTWQDTLPFMSAAKFYSASE